MVTDSPSSFTSYIRHDYFRRIFASYLGQIVESGRFSEQAAMEVTRRVFLRQRRAVGQPAVAALSHIGRHIL